MKKIFTFVFMAMMAVAAFAQDGSVSKVVTCYDMFDGKATPSGQEWTATLGEVTLTCAKAEGVSNPVYNATGEDVRVYAKGTASVKVNVDNQDAIITNVVFNVSAQGKKRLSTYTANTGSAVVDVDAQTVTWTGETTEVTLTVGETATNGTESSKAAQLCFDSFVVTYVKQAPVPTGVADVTAAKQVAGVTYFNLAGQQSATAFEGVNIVKTVYTDGSVATAKMVR